MIYSDKTLKNLIVEWCTGGVQSRHSVPDVQVLIAGLAAKYTWLRLLVMVEGVVCGLVRRGVFLKYICVRGHTDKAE